MEQCGISELEVAVRALCGLSIPKAKDRAKEKERSKKS
jgi:hypothetical protein